MIQNNTQGVKSSLKKKQNNVKVFAFDRSSARISILKERLSQLAPSVLLSDEEETNEKKKQKNKFPIDICPRHEDFLKVDPKDKKYNNVKSILLDPSCSGSGIVNSLDRIADGSKNNETEENRIETLSNFQLVALKHAMSFPQCLRIVYSTCSINQKENEDVVAAALQEVNEQIDNENMKWELVSPMALAHWKRRGFEADGLTKEESKCLIRANGMEDDTNGFFVSYFERKKISSQQQASQPLKLVNDTTIGIKAIYNGEFANRVNDEKEKKSGKGRANKKKEETSERGEGISDGNEDTSSDLKMKSQGGKSMKKEDASSDLSDQKSQVVGKTKKKQVPAKVAKKFLWKQKQKEMKEARLKKKKNDK